MNTRYLPVPAEQGVGSRIRFPGRQGAPEQLGPHCGSLSRPEHRQDRLADRRWQRWPGIDQVAQSRVDFCGFLPVLLRYLLRLSYWAVGRVDVTGVLMAG